jgi:hypothetical protein
VTRVPTFCVLATIALLAYPNAARAGIEEQDVPQAVHDNIGGLAVVLDDLLGTQSGLGRDTRTGRVYVVVEKGKACELTGESSAELARLRERGESSEVLSRQEPIVRRALTAIFTATAGKCSRAHRVCHDGAIGCAILVSHEDADGPGAVTLESSLKRLKTDALEASLLESDGDAAAKSIVKLLAEGPCRSAVNASAAAVGVSGILLRGSQAWLLAHLSPDGAPRCRPLLTPEQAVVRIGERTDQRELVRDGRWVPRGEAIATLYRDACFAGRRWETTLRVSPFLLFWKER